jgi:FkbM family methyltransferase
MGSDNNVVIRKKKGQLSLTRFLVGVAVTVVVVRVMNIRPMTGQTGSSVRDTDTNDYSMDTQASTTPPPTSKLHSGWDELGVELYTKQALEVASAGIRNISIPPLGHVLVSENTNNNPNFWGKVDGRIVWERQTFGIFNKYIGSETVVVDFGTWIGPTLLYHAQLSKHSYGIEADPVAYATAEYNVELNRKANPKWGKRITLESTCVSSPEDVGSLTMTAGRKPGMSMSGIGNKVVKPSHVKWKVQCHTLPSIFDHWGISKPYKDHFIKIDVESYECRLIPSFHDWLKDEQYLPTLFISFHPQIEDCDEEGWKGAFKTFQLYEYVACNDDEKVLPITRDTTFAQFQDMLKTQCRNYDFVLSSNKKGLNP